MLSLFRRSGLLLTLGWMVLWLTVFPLIHVHPEADHAHGDSHHRHGGMAHSVLSKDLPCEFGKESDHHHSSNKDTHLVGFPNHNHGHSHALTHSEITFSALNPSSDGPLKKQFGEHFGVIDLDASLSYSLAWGKHTPEQLNCSATRSIKPYFSRPPPFLTI
jgi:hypothetical protein